MFVLVLVSGVSAWPHASDDSWRIERASLSYFLFECENRIIFVIILIGHAGTMRQFIFHGLHQSDFHSPNSYVVEVLHRKYITMLAHSLTHFATRLASVVSRGFFTLYMWIKKISFHVFEEIELIELNCRCQYINLYYVDWIPIFNLISLDRKK